MINFGNYYFAVQDGVMFKVTMVMVDKPPSKQRGPHYRVPGDISWHTLARYHVTAVQGVSHSKEFVNVMDLDRLMSVNNSVIAFAPKHRDGSAERVTGVFTIKHPTVTGNYTRDTKQQYQVFRVDKPGEKSFTEYKCTTIKNYLLRGEETKIIGTEFIENIGSDIYV